MVPSNVTFAAVQMVILLTDTAVQERAHESMRRQFQRGGLHHVAFYSDKAWPEYGILGCCGEVKITDPEHRLELMFPSILSNAPVGVHWFIMTEGDTWWHLPNLAQEIRRIEGKLLPANPVNDFLVVGGGGFIVFSCFLVLSLPAVKHFADSSNLDECRHRLLACEAYPRTMPAMPNEFAQFRALGCHATGVNTGRNPPNSYAAKDIINYCAAPHLASGACGQAKVGCEWRFGQLARDQETTSPLVLFENWKAGRGPPTPNERARRRFRQNPMRRSSFLLAEREKREGVPDECVPVMCALVGYEHASPSTRAWLDGMVLIQSENKSCCREHTQPREGTQDSGSAGSSRGVV